MKAILTGLMVVALFALIVFTGRLAMSDEDERGEAGAMVDPVTDPLYQQECGACHFAYQPGWLPAASWTAIMGDLANHFGENAELAPDTQASLTAYLTRHAADAAPGDRSPKALRSLKSAEPPLRISTLPYIVRKHHELSRKMVADNPKVLSLSQCTACHTRADAGSFDEDDVAIPGFPNWDD
ncbi:MAG: diheme cytochrome c [Nitrospirota bacterium]